MKAVGMNPDEFVAGGLPGDFDGVVTEARTVIWDYDNGGGGGPKSDDAGNAIFTLAVRTTIHRHEEGDDIVNWWSAGDVRHFVPSMDGIDPAPVEANGTSEGIYFIPIGKKDALNNNTNYAQALKAMRDAGFKGAFSPSVAEIFEGLDAHWDRIPQQKRSGIVGVPREGEEGGRKGNNDILVPTAIKSVGGNKVAAAAKVAPKAAAAATKATTTALAAGNADLDAKLQAIVLENLPEDGSPIKKGSLAGKVMKAASLTQPEKSKGVPRIGSVEFLDAGMQQEPALWLFDAEEGTIAAIPAEE